MRYEIEINPRDVFFFRDGRPIGGSSDGAGGVWPLPSTFHSAVLTAISREFADDVAEWESTDHLCSPKEKEKRKHETTRFQFGGLKTWGPFPKKDGEIYVPTPADISPGVDDGSGGVMRPVKLSGSCNLPAPLEYAVASTGPTTKKRLGQWISLKELQKYLDGETENIKTVSSSELFASETRPGIGIDPSTRSTREHQFYSAEYLRLRRDVSMTAFAECEAKRRGESSGKDVLSEFFDGRGGKSLIFGGQRGVAWLENKRQKSDKTPLDVNGKHTGIGIKWTLLAPALFLNGIGKDNPSISSPRGWLPNWVDGENGNVQLLSEKPDRSRFNTRKEWRAAFDQSFIKARLVAARIPKPITVSGWKIDKNQNDAGGSPKPTRLLVSAGSAYYFLCESQSEAEKLFRELHGRNKSDEWGSQGFGLGVCSTWDPDNI